MLILSAVDVVTGELVRHETAPWTWVREELDVARVLPTRSVQ